MASARSMAERVAGDGFLLDEEPLRQWILKAHHESTPEHAPESREGRLLAAVRDLLSGPELGFGSPLHWFEDHPDAALPAFIAALEEARPGFARALFRPLLSSVEEVAREAPREAWTKPLAIAPNLSAHVAFHAGPLALKTELDETVVCSLLASALIVLSKTGTERARGLLPAADA